MIERRPEPHAAPANGEHAGSTLEGALAQTLQSAERNIAPALHRLADQAGDMARSSLDAMQSGTHQLQAHAQEAGHRTLDYIRHEPVKSVLIAAALGAAAMALVQALRQPPARS